LESVLTPVASARTAVKDRSPLRGAALVPRSTSLTASSLRLLSFHRGAGAPPFFVGRNSKSMNFPWSWRKLLAESKKHQAWKLLRSIPALGPIRAAVLMAIVQTPHRFRNKRLLWKYSGFGVVTHTSADHRYVKGQLERSKKPVSVRGLDRDHNHHLKDLFKSAAIQASTRKGPFQEFYEALVAKGMRPQMARLTLARKIAVIALTVWKKGGAFDAKYLKPQTV